jgi:RNA polymerase sigma-70 factor (ECF subfamily)
MSEAEPDPGGTGGSGGETAAARAEREFLPRHAGGDASAFAELVAAYRAPVFGYLVRSGVEESMRDDLFQEIFLKIHGSAAHYQPERPLRPWLFTVVANTVRSHFRARRVVHLELPPDDSLAMRDSAPDPHRALTASDTARFLERALHRLSLAEREVLILTSIEGLEQNQVSIALQIPVNTVKTHLRRGRMKLAAMLAEREGATT